MSTRDVDVTLVSGYLASVLKANELVHQSPATGALYPCVSSHFLMGSLLESETPNKVNFFGSDKVTITWRLLKALFIYEPVLRLVEVLTRRFP